MRLFFKDKYLARLIIKVLMKIILKTAGQYFSLDCPYPITIQSTLVIS